MKKYSLPLLLLLFIISSDVHAGTVTIADAQSVALNFFKVNNPALNGATLTATLKYTKTEANNAMDFYVFDMNPVRGFVIVAADDRVIPILGYSTESNFNTDFSHIGLNHWVNKTATKIHLAVQNNVAADARIQGLWSAYRQGINPNVSRSGGVGPLCATTWDQEANSPPPYLYNLYCPYNSTDQQRALTGCVATAMAQVMKRWNYPAQGTDSFSYVDEVANGYSNNYGTQSSDFAAHTYQWSNMPVILTGTETAYDDTAVGLLMYDCAVSVGMDFGDDNENGSGANALLANEIPFGDSNCSQVALPKYFGYDIDSIRGVFQDSFSSSAWVALIENEFNLGRPVIYEGNDPTQGGHAWVCDGYDAQNYLHMNWGWSGAGNGFFAWDSLTTNVGGIFDPVDSEDALIGILPKSISAGINTLSGNVSFSLFPNPASNEVILRTSETTNGATWELKNLMGQTLMSGNIEAAQTHISIDDFASGVYLVELRSGESSLVKKLVVSR
jgi:hypothetical protein